MRYLRHRFDGTIYEWSEILSENKLCEEVTEEEAFPERFVPATQKGRKSKIKLETEDVPPEAIDPVNTALNAEASKGLPS